MAVTTIRGGRQISDGTIPYADIQNVTANTILGNNTGSAASIQEIALASSTLLGRAATGNITAITLGTGLSFSGTSIVLSSNTISGVALGSNLFSLTAGTGLSGTAYNGSAAQTWTLATAYGDSINPYGSKTANFVLAAPNGSAGVPTFRALVAADIPALSYQAPLNGTGYVKMSGTTVSYVASIPNADLANSSITVQGTAVSLGGSVNVINGTGFVKASGTTISYDNNTYALSSHTHSYFIGTTAVQTSSANQALTGITGITFVAEGSDAASISTTISSTSTFFDFNLADDNNNDEWRWRFTPSGASVYSAMRLVPVSNTASNLIVSGTITGSQIIRSGGTASQFLKADGSVDSNTYLTGNQSISVTGDATGSGTTSIALTLATVNSNVGTFNNVTVNAKGLVTAASNVSYLTGNQTITLTGDITGSGTTSIATTIGAGKVTNAMLVNSSFYIGTTSISLGRASAAQSLTGITSIDGYANNIRSGEITNLNTSWTDLGTSISNGLQIFRYNSTASNSPEVADNANWVMNIYSHPTGGTASYGHQISGVDNDNIYVRRVLNGSFGTWYKIWTAATLTNLNQLTNGPGYTSNTGTVTSVSGTGTVSGLTLSGTVTTSGSLTLSGTLSLTAANVNAVGSITNSTSGSAGSVANAVTFTTTGGAAAGTTYNGSVARTIDYSTVGAAPASHTHTLLSSAGDYVWTESTAANSYSTGLSLSFVQATNGWFSYGTVINAKGYSSGGGSALQIYVPYSPTYGGNSLKVRFGNYDTTAWTSWKTLWADDNDGSGSGLDADLLDGNHASAFYLATNPNGYTSNTGTVTSVALSLPGIFSVSGSPVTTSGTLTATLASQTANTVFAAPNGAAGAPTFRALVAADIPALSYLTGNQTITLSGDVSGSGTTSIAVTIGAGKVTNAMLVNSSFFIGTTSISLGRASAAQTLTGVSIDGNAATASTASQLTVFDTRSAIQGPNTGDKRVRVDFLANSTDGLSDGGSYHGVLTFQQWTDASGGGTRQLGFTDSDNLWIRGSGSALTSYGSWKRFWHSADFTSTNVSNWNTAYGWGNHSGLYLPLSGGTLTGALTISNGADLNLRAATSSTDSGDLVFQDGAGAELHRLWNGTNTLNYRTAGGTTYQLIHTGNDTDFVRTRSTSISTNSTDFNTIVTPGTYEVSGNGTWTGSSNGPALAYSYGQLIVTVNGNRVTQFYYTHATTGHWVRSKFNASDWVNWQMMWTNTNLTNLNQLTNGPGYITGTGTTNYVAKWTSSSAVGNSQIFDNGTNVGIGTASPGQKLDVAARIRLRSDGTDSAGIWFTDSAGSQDVFAGLGGPGNTTPWGVYSANAWRLTVANGGKTTIYSDDDAPLRVQGSNTWTGIHFTDSGGTDYIWMWGATGTFSIGGGGSTVSGKKLHVHGGMTIGSGLSASSVTTNGLGVEGSITSAGDIIAYGTPSDANLKIIKGSVENALEGVKKLNGYRFDWKNPDDLVGIKEDIGVIAQEVASVFPELARTNSNGNMSVRYQGLTAVLIEAVKEQQSQIESLKKQIEYLVENSK